ncbi:hypothetical protein [Rhodanobacter sp. C05]|uniref:hypothetical protein n=1 Tax=Rhodanobacter sp. C05 TaxID=1945855 RepID=UPI00098792E6|nr:hypothetical protein [Rhodanobacter sp. C05]OOG41587.1 hypothetical protein B0E51_07905 [Rhodanobacter sp. C05]
MRTFAVKLSCFSALLLAAATITPAHAANVCDAVYLASIKFNQTPSHAYVAVHMAGLPNSMEDVFAGGVEYMKVGDQWQRSPLPQQLAMKNMQEKLKTHPDTCTVVGDQIKDGQATTLYRVHDAKMNIDTQEWIAKSSGLLVHETTDLHESGTTDTRIEYSNVQAPAGVK